MAVRQVEARSEKVGQDAFGLIPELFPICRSITGGGFRASLKILERRIPLQVHEVPTGTRVFDWTVPKEWNIRDAFIKNPAGKKIVDFQKSSLHVVSYSRPIRAVLPLEELMRHLYSLPEHPDWVPYRTTYYQEDSGFYLSHTDYLTLKEEEYEVVIDSSLEPGSLSYGGLYLKGEEDSEILISAHACHPSLANDNLSGVAVATMLGEHFASVPHRLSYRILFIPGTIGAITRLSLNEEKLNEIIGGLVLSGIGDPGALTYKLSRRGDALMDRAARHVLAYERRGGRILDFDPYGYDERQYCSPGFNLPVGRPSRTPFGEYPEYHTSVDNLAFIHPEALGESFEAIIAMFDILENDRFYVNRCPKEEPQLGKRGLYSAIGPRERALLWVLNLSDGRHGLLDIAERSGMRFADIRTSADVLCEAGLLNRVKKDWRTSRP